MRISIKKNKKTGAKCSFDSGLLLEKMIMLRLRTAEPDYGNSWLRKPGKSDR